MRGAERLLAVQRGIHQACDQVGRDPDEVGLIAVSKRFVVSRLEEVQRAGQLDFGESYAQELRDKSQVMSDVRWHYIGRIQRNKARIIVHAVSSVRHAVALAKHAPSPLEVLMAVNVALEPTKSGVVPREALALAKEIHGVEGIELVGLMCMPPWREDPEESAPFFEQLSDLAHRGRQVGLSLHELSMGMSHDHLVAIRHGATWVRVGSAIFGPRPVGD